MSTSSELKHCPQCGAPIPAEAPKGLCPKCLLREASVPTEAEAGEAHWPIPPPLDELVPAFPQLEILELIGQGGMGFVFKARQPKLDRIVALKILPHSLAADPAFAERFSREGRTLAKLNHPNIVTIHEFGEANGFFYLLMEYVDGVNLRQAMKVGRFTPEQALAIVPIICEALQFAHNEGILHRDIKPENILLDIKGRVKLADFGIAKLMEGQGALSEKPGASQPVEPAHLTQTGKVLGTPRYMAPEQLERPQDVDQRADIYSLGVVFYEMLTGELPMGRFAPPSKKSGADPRVDEIVLRTLEKERERRYQQAGEVKTDVETLTGAARTKAQFPASHHQRKTESMINRQTHRPWALAVVAILFILSGCSVVWEIAHDLPRHQYDLNVWVLALPIGIGLLRRRPWWRFSALALLWLGFALIAFVAGLAMTGHMMPGASVNVLGWDVTGPGRVWVGGLCYALSVLLMAGMYWALVRPDVKSVFPRGPFVRPWIEWGALAAALLLGVGIEHVLLTTGLDQFNSVFSRSSFGPAVECVVDVNNPERAFFNLTTTEFVKPPADLDPADWTSTRLNDWLADGANADVMATLDRGELRLALCCMVSVRSVANQAWSKPWLLDQQEVQVLTNRTARPDPATGLVDILGGSPPTTWVFQTQNHVSGLLQVVGYGANPREVRIRYKLAHQMVTAEASFPASSAPISSDGEASSPLPRLSAPTSEPRLVVEPARYRVAHPEPGQLAWGFKGFVPAGHLASILFVVWTNGVPYVMPGFSAYYKVPPNGGVDVPFCSLSCDPIPASRITMMTNAAGCRLLADWGLTGTRPADFTNVVQWNVNLGLGFTSSRWLAMPPYHGLKVDLPQSVTSDHQLALRLVEFTPAANVRSNGWSGVELRLFLEPSLSPAIRTGPNELDRTNYIAGKGLPGPLGEALKAIKQWPTMP